MISFHDLQETYDMINTDNWVTTQGCYDWCLEHTNIPFIEGDDHPVLNSTNYLRNELYTVYKGKRLCMNIDVRFYVSLTEIQLM